MSDAMEEVVVATVDESHEALVEANIIETDMSGAIVVETAGETDENGPWLLENSVSCLVVHHT